MLASQMSEREKLETRIALLQALNNNPMGRVEAFQSPLLSPLVAKFGEQAVSVILYGLTDSGLIFAAGSARATVYQTTKIGREIIPAYMRAIEEQSSK